MPRRDKIRERWDETGSEHEDSASYNIPSPNVPSSEDENPEPRPSQYKHERIVQMLEHLRDQSSNDELSDGEIGDYIFFLNVGKLNSSNIVVLKLNF